MKKGTVSPTKSSSSTAFAMKIRTADISRGQNSKGLSSVLNRKTRSCQKFEFSKTNKPSEPNTGGNGGKSLFEKKSCSNESLEKRKVEDTTARELHESLIRVDKNYAQPFTFLNDILDEKNCDSHVSIARTKPTEIDLQLAALKRRVQLNQSLLERTNDHVKEINFLVEKNAMTASRELNYDEKDSEHRTACGDAANAGEFDLNVSCPGITELQRTIRATKDMLGYVKKICSEEIKITDLPKEFANRITFDVETKMEKK